MNNAHAVEGMTDKDDNRVQDEEEEGKWGEEVARCVWKQLFSQEDQ